MGQKVNPISLRLEHTNRSFDNSWYSNYFYKKLITRDVSLQIFFNNFLKTLKLPTGRYSIQHFQKKTQVYHFLCYPKSTREWRTKIFGLNKKKKFFKKTRFFFKNKKEFQKKIKKNTKLVSFYTTLNQQALYQIQKKITSFQNLLLWSTLITKSQKKKSLEILFRQDSLLKNFLTFEISSKDFVIFEKEKKKAITQKRKLNSKFLTSRLLIDTIEKLKRVQFPLQSGEHPQLNKECFASYENKRKTSFNLFFLQNLLIYKTIKSNLKKKENINVVRNQPKFSELFNFPLTKSNFDSFFMDNFSKRKFQKELFNLKYKNYLEYRLFSTYKLNCNITPFIVENDWQHANFLADEILFFLERRIPFHRLKTKLLKQLSKISKIRGVRITCSGRVGGKSKKAQRAKTECIKYGQTSLQVFSSKIDFSVKTAFTSFGSVGVKVWICYN